MKRVVAVLPSLAGGGAERVTLTLLAGLDRRRFAPHLLLFDRRGPLEAALPADLPVTDLAEPRLRWAVPQLLMHLRRLQPDITFSTLGYVNLALVALRFLLPGSLIIREANLPSLSLLQSRKVGLMTFGYRQLYPRADLVVATSRRMAAELSNYGVPPSRLVLLRNPVAVDALRRQAAAPYRPPGHGLRLVAAGRLTEQKGFDRLIPLLGMLPQAQLSIIGDGPQRAMLMSLAQQYGARVDLPGFVSDAPARFAGADAVLLPSRWEGMPNVALEALACGTPVIATPESGGIAEVSAAAPPDAVTIVGMQDAFGNALANLSPRQDVTLRASLLPPAYDADVVNRTFEGMLDAAG